jgi:hypothetical protein
MHALKELVVWGKGIITLQDAGTGLQEFFPVSGRKSKTNLL